jgi:hypothetical protein
MTKSDQTDFDDDLDIRPPRSASRSRVRFNAALKVVRRVHMYFGLFLTPWVFVYGVSAFLFNHPDAFSDQNLVRLGRSETAGTPLDAMPDGPELAARVVAGLNARADGKTYRLRNPRAATIALPIGVAATSRGGGHLVRYDLDARSVTILPTPKAGNSVMDPSAGKVLKLEDPPRKHLEGGISALLRRLKIESDKVSVRFASDLIFEVEADGKPVRVAYNIQTERVTVRPADQAEGRLSNRRFLTGLHLASGYPSQWGSRWFWAIIVDVLAGAMIFWGCSGLLMWWQMKSLRRWGVITLVISIATAAALGTTMHAILPR